MESNIKLCRTAAALCSSAIHEMVPGCDLLGGGETETGFFYQFFYSKTISSEIGKMLEERMRQIVREDRPIRQMEMVAFSAKQMFQKAYHAAACDILDEAEPKELVSVVRIGDFVDLAEGPFCDSIKEVGAFQITGFKSLGDGEYRVEGCVASSKDELKEYLRKLRRYADENHLTIGSELNLWESLEEGIVWLARGLEARRSLIQFLKKEIGPNSCDIQAESDLALDRYAQRKIKQKGTFSFWTISQRGGDPEGDIALFEERSQTFLQQTIYHSSEEFRAPLFSLLQSIHKTLIILGFHPELCLCGRSLGEKGLKLLEQGLLELGMKARFESDEKSGSRLQWIVRDGLGRPRIAAELKADSALSLKLSVERILGLLLELTLGNLPNWLFNGPKTTDRVIEQDFQT